MGIFKRTAREAGKAGKRVVVSSYWWIDYTTAEGKRVREPTKYKHTAGSTEQTAENKRLALGLYHERLAHEAKIHHGHAPRQKAITFAAFVAWYREHESAHKRGAAAESYVLNQLARAFGARPLASLTKQDYREWMTARLKAATPNTVNRQVDVLKDLLASAVPKYLAASPLAGMPRLRVLPRETVVLERRDEAKLLKVLPPHDRALVIAAIDGLIREGDLLKLTWRHDRGAFLAVDDPKEGNPYKAHVSTRLRAALMAIKPHPATGRIFPQYRHKDEVLRMLRRACQNAGVTYGRTHGGITFHSLRHTGATRLMDAGYAPQTIMKAGGWKDIRSVARYTHPSDKQLQQAVNRIGRGVPRL